jgi:hypothetical protein
MCLEVPDRKGFKEKKVKQEQQVLKGFKGCQDLLVLKEFKANVDLKAYKACRALPVQLALPEA